MILLYIFCIFLFIVSYFCHKTNYESIAFPIGQIAFVAALLLFAILPMKYFFDKMELQYSYNRNK